MSDQPATPLDGKCPACRAPLRVAPARDEHGVWRPPSMRLELGKPIAGEGHPWRLSTFPDAAGQVIERGSAGFTRRSLYRVYDLCGDGHIFLASKGTGRAVSIRHWNVVAAIGGSATGKSYLLARALAQTLRATGAAANNIDGHDTALQYEALPTDRIEDLAGDALREAYDRTHAEHVQMLPTTRDEMLPAELLADKLSAKLQFPGGGDLVQVIMSMHIQLAGGRADAEDRPDHDGWGRRIRQPIVLRTRFGRDRSWTPAWTGVADLAGETFRTQRFDDEVQTELLRSFDSLVWVVDPAINEQVTQLIRERLDREAPTDALIRTVIAASTRSDPGADLGATQRGRENVQGDVAGQLAQREDGYGKASGSRLRLHIAVTKCDLIREALAVNGFDRIGPKPDSVTDGVITYLQYVLRRSGTGDPFAARILPGPELALVLDRLRRENPTVQNQRVRMLAEGLVEHYSSPALFWSLVDDGKQATIPLRAGADHRFPGTGPLVVPSIGTHLVSSLQPDRAGLMHLRDLVMSAIGCGLVFGLGYDVAMDKILANGTREVRVFLCSPLGELPAQTSSATGAAFRPANAAASFPGRERPSAGLTQLMLAILRGARE